MYHANNELFSEPLIDYLQTRGWSLVESEPDIAVLRKLFDGEEAEITLPRNRAYADYRQRILETVRYLAKRERSSERDIIEEVLLQKWDVLRIKIKGERIGSGCISYFDKGIIEEGVRKVLFAAARSVCDPKAYFKRLYSAAAEQWIKKCRAAAPESGSYVLTVRMPLEEDSEELPFSRKVAEYLMKSLSKLIELSESLDLLTEQKEFLLNANLCLGLAEMKPDEVPIHFDFEMKWSSEVPINQTIPTKIEIQDRHFPRASASKF